MNIIYVLFIRCQKDVYIIKISNELENASIRNSLKNSLIILAVIGIPNESFEQ